MKRILVITGMFFLTFLSSHAQDYRLRLTGTTGTAGREDECNARNITVSFPGLFYQGRITNTPYEINETEILTTGNLPSSINMRITGNFSRVSCPPIHSRTVELNYSCSRGSFSFPNWVSNGSARLEIIPIIDLSFADGTRPPAINYICESERVRINATAGFPDPQTVYNWQFFDNITSSPGVWRNITRHTGSSSIDLTLSDLFPNATNRARALDRSIPIRINPNCGTVEELPSNVLTVNYQQELPDFATTPYSVTQPSCSDSNDAVLKLNFDRQIDSSSEQMSINLINTDDNRPYGSNIVGFNGTSGTQFVPEGNGVYSHTWRVPNDGRPLVSGNYRVEIAGFISGATISCPKDPINIRITAPTAVSFTATKIRDEVCPNQNNGQIRLTASGGNNRYQYRRSPTGGWQNFSSGNVITLTHDTYQILVRDGNQCIGNGGTSTMITIEEATRITHTVGTVTEPSAPGRNDAIIRITSVSGGNPVVSGVRRYYNYTILTTTPNITGTADREGFDILGLPAGVHRIRYTDANGCPQEYTLPRINDPQPITFDVGYESPSCSASQDGRIILENVNGGYPPYTYVWTRDGSPYGTGQSSITGGQDNYSVVVTDTRNGRVESTNLSFSNIPDPITIDSVEITELLCYDGTVSATIATSGSGNYEYGIWNGTSTSYITSNVITDIPYSGAGYRFVVRDATAQVCVSEISELYQINRPDEFYIDYNPTSDVVNNTVNGGNSGSITITPQGGRSPYTVTWEVEGSTLTQTGASISGLPAGNYVASVTDANNCSTTSGTIAITEPDRLTALIDITNLIPCYGGTGTLTVSALGGLLDQNNQYRYQWFVEENSVFIPINAANGAQLENVLAGNYQVEVSDDYTTTTASIILNQPDLLTLSVSKTDVSCYDGTDGTIVLTPDGGTAPYFYSLDDVNYMLVSELADNTVTGLAEGDYTIYLRDSEDCTLVNAETIRLDQPEAISIVETDNQAVTTVGGTNGSLDITVTLGASPYTFNWTLDNDPVFTATTEDINNLSAGNYTVIVTDDNGCPQEGTFEIQEPGPLLVELTQEMPVLCYGEQTGELLANVSGGFPINSTVDDFEFRWYVIENGTERFLETGNGLVRLENLGAGIYRVEVEDTVGTQNEATLEITQPDDLVLELESDPVHVLCHGSATGSIDVTVTGGPRDENTGAYYPYNFRWSKQEDPDFEATTEDLEDITSGTYELVVIDENLCTTSLENPIVITQPDAPLEIYDIVATNLTGYQTQNGSISLEVRGGTSPYEYEWIDTNNPLFTANSQDIGNLPSGSYELLITDANGCTIPLSQQITEPNELIVRILPIEEEGGVQCFGELSVVPLTTTTEGGSGEYTYQWYEESDPNTILFESSETATIPAGIYVVLVSDENGNIDTDRYEITEPNALEISETITNLLCNGDRDGTIDITVNGGVPPYSYSWSNGEQTEDIGSLSAGNYIVTVTDANQCILEKEYRIEQPPALFIRDITRVYPSSDTARDGSITLDIGGGTTPYRFVWQEINGAIQPTTTNILSNVGSEKYSAQIIDANNCMLIIEDVDLFVPPALEVLVERVSVVSCFEDTESGSLRATVTGGIPFNSSKQYNYQWFNADTGNPIGEDAFILEGIGAGNYYVTVSDAVDVSATSLIFQLGQPDLLQLELESDFINCGDQNDWFVSSIPSGGTPPYRYLWSNGTSEGQIENVNAGTYWLELIDSRGCSARREITLTPPETLIADISYINPTCYEGCDGTASLSVQGGTAPYTYQWSNGITTQNLTDLCEGSYEVIVTDSKGCTVAQEITLENPEQLIVDLGEDITLCLGQSTLLDATISDSNASYEWISTNGFTSTQATIEVATTGIYEVEVTDSRGCIAIGSIYVEATSEVISANFLSSTQVFVSQEFVIVDNSDPFPDSVEWIFPPEAVVSYSDQNYAEVQFDVPGTFSITQITHKGLCEESITKIVTVVEKEFDETDDSSSADDIKTFIHYSVFPNPTTDGNFSINIELSEVNDVNLKIFNMTNNLELDSRGSQGSMNYDFTYNMASLPSGLYFLLIEVSNGSSRVHKLVVN
ncbi:T9SS type A sorting domain-containing protein [Aquimarina sp. M1]